MSDLVNNEVDGLVQCDEFLFRAPPFGECPNCGSDRWGTRTFRDVAIREPKFAQVADVTIFKVLDGVRYVTCHPCGAVSKEDIDCPACGTPRWCEMSAS